MPSLELDSLRTWWREQRPLIQENPAMDLMEATTVDLLNKCKVCLSFLDLLLWYSVLISREY